MKLNTFTALALLLFTAANLLAYDPKPNRINVRSFIDEEEVLYVRGNEIWFKHEFGTPPGTWGGYDRPTYVNGIPWKPTWIQNFSDRFRIENAVTSFPFRKMLADEVAIFMKSDNMEVKILDFPCDENNFTLTVEIDNSENLQAHWVEFEIEWNIRSIEKSIDYISHSFTSTVHIAETIIPIVPTTQPSPTPVGRR